MPYLTCPQCHASFHTGVLYVAAESCPRCGAPFHPPRRHFRDHLRFRRGARVNDAVDWEAITGAQYSAREYVSESERHRKLDV